MQQHSTHLLFVYGTLMSTATGPLGRDMRLRLRREARLIGPATTVGRLYDLGRYPGLVRSADPAEVVHGEVLTIVDPDLTFPWLDAYEGVDEVAGTPAEYTRTIIQAKLATGETVAAWVYQMNQPVTGLPRVAGGRWKPRG